MKKIVIILVLFLLTGCSSCERSFTSMLTKNYSKDAKRCEVVTYRDKGKNVEIVTTPSEDKKTFTLKINLINTGNLVNYGYSDVQYTNLKFNQYNGVNFIELYDTNKGNNTYLLLFDDVGNIRYETASTSKPIIDGEKFTVFEYYNYADGDYICNEYKNTNVTAYIEKTYNMMDMTVVKSKQYLIKDLCK